MSANRVYPAIPSPAVADSPSFGEKKLKSRWSDQSLNQRVVLEKKSIEKKFPEKRFHSLSIRSTASSSLKRDTDKLEPTIAISQEPPQLEPPHSSRPDKASRILGIRHRRSMEPIPASNRNSVATTRSVGLPQPAPPSGPTFPLTSMYIVSGLPKSPHTWTLADPDSVNGLHHSEGAVTRWWRPEVLGSTVSPGAGGGTSKRKKKGKVEEGFSSAGYLNKQDVGKILSKSLKVFPPLPLGHFLF
jgi:nicotinamide N-methyltransferase